MALLAVCRCGAEVDASTIRAGRCRTCQADHACVADRAELARLWRKRECYRGLARPHANTDAQALRVRDRILKRCLAIDPSNARELSNRQADLAGQTVRGRILLPQEA